MRIARSTALVLALAGIGLSSIATGPAQAALPSKKVWLHDVAVVMRPAIPYLERRVARADAPLAVVLDIDNTSLASHYAWPRPVRKTRAFARRAHELGVRVFFVTGRFQADAKRQRPTLRAAGYPVNGICGRRHGEAIVHSKTRCRKAIVARGLTIVASVGNLPTDFRGGSVGRRFDLPDYGGQLS